MERSRAPPARPIRLPYHTSCCENRRAEWPAQGLKRLVRLEMLAAEVAQCTDFIAEAQHHLGDNNADISLAEGVRGALEGVSLVLQHIGSFDGSSASASGENPLMRPY